MKHFMPSRNFSFSAKQHFVKQEGPTVASFSKFETFVIEPPPPSLTLFSCHRPDYQTATQELLKYLRLFFTQYQRTLTSFMNWRNITP